MALLGGEASLRAEESEEGLYLRFDTGRSFVEGIGGATLVDGGVGYRVSPYLRGDVTMGYRFDYGSEVNVSMIGQNITFKTEGNALVGMVNV
ncbi:MAG: hypothetical protein FD149_2686, partial [Rhodospirillaceae bacterium]